MGWRLGFNTRIRKLDPIALFDVRVHITDQDNKIHVRTFPGKISWWENPYANDVMWDAKHYAKSDRYHAVETDDGIVIPHCNVKQFTFEKFNERTEIPEEKILGLRDWGPLEWFVSLVMFGFCSVFLLLLVAAAWPR